jgi:hypothetical protein
MIRGENEYIMQTMSHLSLSQRLLSEEVDSEEVKSIPERGQELGNTIIAR